MSANMRLLRREVPRAFEVIARDAERDRDPSRRRVGKKELARRLEPLMDLIASGDIPMDNQAAQALATYVESRGSRD